MLFLFVTAALADQCAWITPDQASAGLEHLPAGASWASLCEPCGETKPELHTVGTSSIANPSGDHWEVSVDGKGVDLAYTFVKTSKDASTYTNVAKLIGCEATGVSREISATGRPAPLQGVRPLPFDRTSVPASLRDDVVGGLRFQDANGDNLFVLAQNAMGDLAATHLVVSGEQVTTKRKVVQPRGACDFDYTAAFVPGATGVTDLDADGLGEITFAYKFACRSDVSPQEYKVLVLENGTKAILRGTEVLTFQDGEGRTHSYGDGRPQPEGFEAHPTWSSHAEQVWKRHLVTRMGG